MKKNDCIKWTQDEIMFVKNNYLQCTKEHLLEQLNSDRKKKITLGALLYLCSKLNIRRGYQIRWSKEDIEYLKSNFRKFGDTELALKLTDRKNTYRIINGKKIYRTFNKKNVEKKRDLLGLKRTGEEVFLIRSMNIKTGLSFGWTKENNTWTMGNREPAKEGEIRIWDQDGRKTKWIKINGRFEVYIRWKYEKFVGPIPDNKVLHCKDGDTLNTDLNNWELADRSEILDKNIGRKLLEDRYVIKTLSHGNPELKEEISKFPELIKLKRQQLKLRRAINECTDKA